MKYEVLIDKKTSNGDDSVYKMGIYKTIKMLEESVNLSIDYKDDIFFAKQINVNDEMIRLSIEN